MKHLIQLSTAAIIALMMAAPAFAQEKKDAAPVVQAAKPAPWWTSDKFKEKFADWAGKFATGHENLNKLREAHKAAAAAHKAEKDKAAKAKLAVEVWTKRVQLWEAEILWIELHKEWKKFEAEKAAKTWDERIAKLKELIAKDKERLAKVPTK